MIVHRAGYYHVVSEDGTKNLGGPYRTRAEAEKRLQQVEMYKAMNQRKEDKKKG